MADIVKLTNIEELLKKYEEKKLNKQALRNFSIEEQLRGYYELLNQIDNEITKLENLEKNVDFLDIKNPVRTKAEVKELIIRLLELKKSIYDRLKDFRTSEEEQQPFTAIQINFIPTTPNNAINDE